MPTPDILQQLDAAAELQAARFTVPHTGPESWTDRSRAWHAFADAATGLDHAAIAAAWRAKLAASRKVIAVLQQDYSSVTAARELDAGGAEPAPSAPPPASKEHP